MANNVVPRKRIGVLKGVTSDGGRVKKQFFEVKIGGDCDFLTAILAERGGAKKDEKFCTRSAVT